MKKSLAWGGTIFMFLVSLMNLSLSLGSESLLWKILSWMAIGIYIIALGILILDYYQTRRIK